MSEDESKKAYVTFKLSKDFCQLIDELVEKSKYHFEGRTDVMKFAIRKLYNEEFASRHDIKLF